MRGTGIADGHGPFVRPSTTTAAALEAERERVIAGRRPTWTAQRSEIARLARGDPLARALTGAVACRQKPRGRLQGQRRMGHTLAGRRQAPPQVRVPHQDRSEGLLPQRDRPTPGPRRTVPRDHARPVLRPVPGPVGPDRHRPHQGRRCGNASPPHAATSKGGRSPNSRAPPRISPRGARASPTRQPLPADARAPADTRRRRPLGIHHPQPRRPRRPKPRTPQRGAPPVHARRTRRARPRTRTRQRTARHLRGRDGLRTNEWTAVERRDIVRGEKPAVLVQRRFSDGVETPYPKTSRRRVPLTPRALEAVEACRPGWTRRSCSPPVRAGISASTTGGHATGTPRSKPPGYREKRRLPPPP
jgi:hypothetical protein